MNLVSFRKCIALACLLILSAACKKENPDEKPVAKGDIQVAIQCQTIPEITSGATVYSDPPGITGTTDATGTVFIRDVPVGTYQLFSYLTGYGGGKTAVSIQEGQLSEALIILIPGYNPAVGPIIESILPNEEDKFSDADSILFKVKVKDLQTTPQKLKVKLESDHDGVLFDGTADQNGYVIFQKKLTEDVHKVKITVTDENNFSATHSFNVNVVLPAPVILNAPVINDKTALLSWSKSTSKNFNKYEVCVIYNDGYESYIVKTIMDANLTSFLIDPLPVSEKVTYFIRVQTQQGEISESNLQQVNSVYGYFINEDVYYSVLDAETNSIYIHGRTKVYRIDYITKQLLATWDAPLDMRYDYNNSHYIAHMSIADNGSGKELYISYAKQSFEDYEFKAMVILNAQSLISKKHFTLPGSYGFRSSTTNGNGYFFVLMKGDDYWDWKVYSIRRSDFQISDSYTVGQVCNDMKHIPGKNELILLGEYNFEHIYYDSQGKFTNIVEQPSSEYFDYYELNPFVMSPDGSYFLVTSEGRLYSTDTQLTFQNKDLFTSYDWLQDYCISSANKIYGISYGTLYKYSYPSLQNTGEMTNAIYDERFVLHDGTRLVIINSAGPQTSFISTLEE